MSAQDSGACVRVVRATGEIDITNLDALVADLDKAVAESPHGFVIDLSETIYMDSGAMSAILYAYQRVRPDGRLALVVTNDAVQMLFDVIHPEHLPGFVICGDLSSAKRVFC